MQIKSIGVVLLLLAILLVTGWLNPSFLSDENVKSIIRWTSLFGFISLGMALVIMTGEDLGKPVALIHLADTWLLAEFLPASKTPAWRVLQAHDAKRSFSGTTAELVKVLAGLKAGK